MDAVTEFARSLRINSRVIGALLMREIITRYGRNNLGFLWLFIEPMLFTAGVTVLWTATRGIHGSSLPIVAFAVTGYSSVLLWRNCATRCSMAIPPNVPLLYHRNVRVLDLLTTRILLEIAGATISFVLLSSILIFLDLIEWPADIARVIIGWFYLCWVGAALALIVGALTAWSDFVERIWHTGVYLIFPLSGALFMVDWLPRDFQQAVLLIPMVHGTEMLREGYFGSSIRAHYDESYLAVVSLVMTLVGLALARDAGRKIDFV